MSAGRDARSALVGMLASALRTGSLDERRDFLRRVKECLDVAEVALRETGTKAD